jgi:PAS domain S-box-containing protein
MSESLSPSSSQPVDASPTAVFDRLDSGVMLLSGEGVILYANRAMQELLVVDDGTIVGHRIDTLMPPAKSFLGRACITALATEHETATVGKDTLLDTWIGIRTFPATVGIEVHARAMPDVTEAIPPTELVFKDETVVSLDSITVPMHIVDLNGVIQYANQADLQLLGYSRDDYVGHSITELHVDSAAAQEHLQTLRGGVESHSFEVQLRHADGSVHSIQITAGPHASGTDTPYIQCFSNDVTVSRAAELRDAHLAAIVESSDDAIIGKRMDGVIISWNQGAERLYGYTADEAIGRPVTLIMPDEMEDEFPSIMIRLARGEQIDHYETVRVDKHGRRIDVSVSIAPIRGQSGRIIGAAAIARDISDRRVLERKQNEFLTMVAHDLRSPLTAVKGYAQLMQRREKYSESAVSAILAQVHQMERLVGDVLEITRMDENRLEIARADVDLVELAQGSIGRARDFTGTTRIQLDAPKTAMVGYWDGGRLSQVLDNLITNAVKYAPEGEIVVRLVPHDDHATVMVEDHGPGIPPENLPHIFDRFYRGTNGSNSSRGVGLGLAITKALVEAHGGEIDVESSVGEGTRFTVTLPWRQPASEAPTAATL